MKMLRFSGFKFLLILSIFCYLTHPVLSGCRDAYFDEKIDYFPTKVFFYDDGKSNVNINVTYFNHYIILTNSKTFETFVLYCTETQPNVLANVSSYIQVPVTTAAVTDRTVLSFLEILGEERTLKYVSDKSSITSPCLQKYDNLYDTIDFFNTTQIASFDVIFTSPLFPKMGGKYFTITYDEDTSALQRAEWIKLISLFFNKTEIANEAFDKIRNNYLCHMDNLSNVSNSTKKTIAWVSLESDNTFTVKSLSFYSNITNDAAAYPLDLNISTKLTVIELQQNIVDAYIVIDISNLTSQDITLDTWKRYFGYDKISVLPRFLVEKRLFRTHKLLNKNGFDDWSETSASRPDLLIQDLIAIQYPLYQQNYNVRWFDKFAETGDYVIISPSSCNDSTFGSPKINFGTCNQMKFLGDGLDNNGDKIIGNKDSNDEKTKANLGVIIAVILIGSFLLFGLGTWSFIVARKKYRKRFVKLHNEPAINE